MEMIKLNFSVLHRENHLSLLNLVKTQISKKGEVIIFKNYYFKKLC